MLPKERILNVPVYKPGKPIDDVKRELGLTEVIKLASNENPYGYSPVVKEAMLAAMNDLAIYPDGASMQLRWELAEFLNVQPEQLIFGNGSDEIVLMISRAYLEKGTNSVMATPTFSQYRSNVTVEGADLLEIPLKNGVHDLEAMLAAINEQTRVVWVCNPNNPSGTMNTSDELLAFLEKVPANVLVVLDEAYYEYVVDENYPQTIPLLDKYKNMIILRTFSKIYGLAALRIGYGIANPDVVSHLNHVRGPFNTGSLSQVAARAAISDQEFVTQCSQKNRQQMKRITDKCDELGLHYFPSQTNFVLFEVKRDSDEAFQYLLKKGIITRSGNALGHPGYLRVTIGNSEQNDKLLAALESLVTEAVKK
ncbi:histidinol-phosphate transaminase [Brevibacillus laterosporus]|uniref:Histidinol-phosphate aminotransferase n=2 Tax=Brevibacillus TaxID=55080 RepID=A0A0F7C1C4_BRELA|nr:MULTISPECIES: histidinol-phosphate transaminase [Brevibacillus]AKF95475.1 histidinol-phosphate aminotransferase [Brevibacillus laterosporus]MCR8986230.1 histidinol-phosphate transaminase [Brevibacillus laterosporus]MCZ0831963.1 histidinol-phosphate transaminase [Brevibacillus halotolerans]GIO00340.1 histidinol-phosphate aminotransferase [Brevibacillus halotolerans]